MSYEQAQQAIAQAKAAGVTRLALIPEAAKKESSSLEKYFNDENYSQMELIWLTAALTDIPPEIGQLTNLTTLFLGSNQLSHLPAEIGQLTNLTTLFLGSNQLSQLPAEFCQLTNLTTLWLSDNQLSQLPAEFCQLTNLTGLYLSSNQLSQLPTEFRRLTNLRFLFLQNNQLSLLPAEIARLPNLETVRLENNRLKRPPQAVADEGLAAVRHYFDQLAAEGEDTLCEAKLLIVGEPGAGKTTLARKLLNPQAAMPSEEESTRGIDIETWEFPTPFKTELKATFQANLWDFAGQEIYQATHRFFLTTRSLYLLVADSRKEETDFFYWLNIIKQLGGDSPLLVINNEKDDRPRALNEQQLREQSPNLRQILATNLATGRGLPELRETIQLLLTQLPHVGDVLPRSWVRLRQALETDERNYIDWREYVALCEQHGLQETSFMETLSHYLHELGICLHYQDDRLLKRTVFLKPEWCTAAVYKVLDSRPVIEKKGRFSQAELDHIWQDAAYEPMRLELLQMMVKFQLCYKIPGTADEYIAPQLLDPRPPAYAWPPQSDLQLRYRYAFMPKGLVNQLTVRLHRYIWEQRYVWQGGVILARDQTRAEIQELSPQREITLRVQGDQPRDLLRTVMDGMAEIHASYPHLDYAILVPCNCAECRGRATPNFYEYEQLRQRQSKNKRTIECYVSYEDVLVEGLLEATLGSAEEQERRSLSPSLRRRLTSVLIDCSPFESNRQLQTLFVDSRLTPWKGRLSQVDSVEERVDVVLSELHQRYNRHDENALVLFLAVLQERVHPDDRQHGQLDELITELRAVKQTRVGR